MKHLKKYLAGVVGIALLLSCFQVEYYTYKLQSRETIKQKPLDSYVAQENQKEKELKEQKVAYLTFDDGPSCNTKRVLDVLRTYEINATFFLIGSSITVNTKPIVERMIKEGNAVGVHTYSHEANTMYASADTFKEDFLRAEEIINEATGKKARLCRFPWGSANNYLKKIDKQIIPWLEEKGYYYCDWNVSAEDSVGKPTVASILHNIKKDYTRYEHPIILMHDSNTNCLTAEILPDIIVMLKQDGYKFDTLDHMEKSYQYARN